VAPEFVNDGQQRRPQRREVGRRHGPAKPEVHAGVDVSLGIGDGARLEPVPDGIESELDVRHDDEHVRDAYRQGSGGDQRELAEEAHGNCLLSPQGRAQCAPEIVGEDWFPRSPLTRLSDGRLPQFGERPGLKLADAFPGEVEVLADFVERARLSAVEAEAQRKDLPLPLVE
jgi:hypothetical protein